MKKAEADEFLKDHPEALPVGGVWSPYHGGAYRLPYSAILEEELNTRKIPYAIAESQTIVFFLSWHQPVMTNISCVFKWKPSIPRKK
jgi:hypothetical protein